MVVALSILSIIALYPFYSMIMMGTYEANDLFKGIKLFPGNYLKENLTTLWSIDIARYYLNSLIAAFGSSVLCVIVCSMAGFGFAKYKSRFKSPLFVFILITMMVPTQLGLVAFVMEMRTIGWINSLLPLIIPSSANAFGVFWMTQFVSSAVPDEVLESGRIDGCSEFRIFLQIALPFMMPACTTLCLLAFLWSWNNLMVPLTVISSDKLFTIPLGIRQLATSFRTDSGAQILGLTISTLPILVFFGLFSKSLISGLSAAAVKG
jgi:multiple sugar transport system permease protein/cellobiose transport system permease protein